MSLFNDFRNNVNTGFFDENPHLLQAQMSLPDVEARLLQSITYSPDKKVHWDALVFLVQHKTEKQIQEIIDYINSLDKEYKCTDYIHKDVLNPYLVITLTLD